MTTKAEKYTSLMRAAQSLLAGERDEIAKMANLAALLHHEFGFWWTGFYRVAGNELILGPFQGPLACMHIGYGKGVCGTAWAEQRTVVVPDVEQFPGHIACSSESKSEIVVPVRKNGTIVAVLDIDSRELSTFDDTDRVFLEQLTQLLHPEEAEIWFAAGCFWGAQKFFKMLEGVISTEVGFANGDTQNPSYQEVYTDTTGHAECVHVVYRPDAVSLRTLTELFFQIIDPLSVNRQGEDVGTRYRTGVYFNGAKDAGILMEIFEEQKVKYGENLAAELLPLKCFYTAEDYHQDYLDKNPNGYCHLSPAVFELAQRWRKLK